MIGFFPTPQRGLRRDASNALNGENSRNVEIEQRVPTILQKRIKRKVMRHRGSGVVDKTDYPKTSSGGGGGGGGVGGGAAT